MKVTLNIGMMTRGGWPLCAFHVKQALERHCPSKLEFFLVVPTPGEDTCVVVFDDEPPNRPRLSWGHHILRLAEELEQDCIAWQRRLNHLTGKGAEKYLPFDINKFITKEQAMSYGAPKNPARIVVGDKVQLKDQAQFDGQWQGAMIVSSIHSGTVLATHPERGLGGFAMEMLEPCVTPKPLIEQIEEAKAAYTEAQDAVRHAAEKRDALVAEFRKLRDAEAAAKKAENERIVPVEFTAEELGYLLALTGKLCGDSGVNTRVFDKLFQLGLPKSLLRFDIKSAKGGTAGVWLKAESATK